MYAQQLETQRRGATADFLFIDELREVDQVAYAAAMPITRARPNSQTLLASNAGDAFSLTLNELHERCLSHPPESLGYYEYSAPAFAALDDRKAWALANPALGILVTEASILEALTTQTTEQFRTETLCANGSIVYNHLGHMVALKMPATLTLRMNLGL
jgi:hypothetical protein